MKRTYGYFSPICLMLLCVSFAHAQATLDVHLGVSGATAKSTGQDIETFGDGVLYRPPA